MAADVTIPAAPKYQDNAVIFPLANNRLIDILSALTTKIEAKYNSYADTLGSKTALLFFDSEDTMSKVTSLKSLEIDSKIVPIFPFIRSHSKIYLKRVPPFIPDSLVQESLKTYGEVLKISRSNVRFPQPEFQHVLSFAREATMQLEIAKNDVPREIKLRSEGTDFIIHIDTAAQRCYKCNGINHISSMCTKSEVPKSLILILVLMPM